MGEEAGVGGQVCIVCWKTLRGSEGACGRCRVPLHSLRNPFVLKELRDKARRVRGRRSVAELALLLCGGSLAMWGAWQLVMRLIPGVGPIGWDQWVLFAIVPGINLGGTVAAVLALAGRPASPPQRWWQPIEAESLTAGELLRYLGTVVPERLMPSDPARPSEPMSIGAVGAPLPRRVVRMGAGERPRA
jgi:hypothetical protein